MKDLRVLLLLGLLLFFLAVNKTDAQGKHAQGKHAKDNISIDVNFDMEHIVGGKSVFERQKYVTLHATFGRFWNDEKDKIDYVFDSLDVYNGRDNGGINWWLREAIEDEDRPGFADPTNVIETGQSNLGEWAKSHQSIYDNKADIMIGGQVSSFWPGLKAGWEIEGPTAAGEFMAHYVNSFFRNISDNNINNGHPAPRFLEILNEPIYNLYDDWLIPAAEKVPYIDIFTFHRDAARSFKKFNTTTMIGGYTAAFPWFDEDNFQRWDERMKLFMDTAGEDMDFYSLHFYDVNKSTKSGDIDKPVNFKGSRMDATIDMVEQYGMLKFGSVKPMVISEFGGKDQEWNSYGKWSPQQDWATLKAMSPMMLQYMERPQYIEKIIPFIMTKTPWQAKPYPWRLMRQAWEPEKYEQNNETTEYVFTDLIKLYELWSDVNGTRVDSRATNPDLLTDAYVDGNKAYLIFSSLSDKSQRINLNIDGLHGNKVVSIKVKQLYAVDEISKLDTYTCAKLKKFSLAPEATAIVEYTFETANTINQVSNETKYFADDYKKAINTNEPIKFNINNVSTDSCGEAVLRVSFGRAHKLSKRPEVLFNGNRLNVPENFAGLTQEYRKEGFFGMLKIPVPYSMINGNNKVSVKFEDAGGFVSSVTLQVFNMSKQVLRSDSIKDITVYPNNVRLGVEQKRILTANPFPSTAPDIRMEWLSSDEAIVTVDSSGNIIGKSIGETYVKVKTFDGGLVDSCFVTVESAYVTVEVDSVLIEPTSMNMIVGKSAFLEYSLLPIDTDNKTIKWSSSDTAVISVNKNAKVMALAVGKAKVIATADNGKKGICFVGATTTLPGNLEYDNVNKLKNTEYWVGDTLTIICNYTANTRATVGSNGVKFLLRELNSSWGVVKDYTYTDLSAAGKFSGTAVGQIPLTDLKPSYALPEGNFYYIMASFEDSTGEEIRSVGLPKIQILSDGPAPEGMILYDQASKYKTTVYHVGETMKVNCRFTTDKLKEVSSAGVVVLLRQLNSSWEVVKDYKASDVSAAGKITGDSEVFLSLDNVIPSADLPTGDFYYLIIKITDVDGNSMLSEGLFKIKIKDSIPAVPGTLLFKNISAYKSTVYKVNDSIQVNCEFNANTGLTVGNDGVKFILQELTSDLDIVEEYEAYDASVAGKVSGTAMATISLEGVPSVVDLPVGNFYSLQLTFTESDGNRVFSQAISPITIKNNVIIAVKSYLNNSSNLQIYPNPANKILNINGATNFSTAIIYNRVGAIQFSTSVVGNTIDVSSLDSGMYILELISKKKRMISKIVIQH